GQRRGRGGVQGGEERAGGGRGGRGAGQPLWQRQVQQRHAGKLGIGQAPRSGSVNRGCGTGSGEMPATAARSPASALISSARRAGSDSLLKRTTSSPLTS